MAPGTAPRAARAPEVRPLHLTARGACPALLARLRAGTGPLGTVHSIFRRSANLRLQDGALVHLQEPGPLIAPFGVSLEGLGAALAAGALEPGASVVGRGRWLEVGDAPSLMLALDRASAIEVQIPELGPPPRAARGAARLALLTILRRHGQLDGLAGPVLTLLGQPGARVGGMAALLARQAAPRLATLQILNGAAGGPGTLPPDGRPAPAAWIAAIEGLIGLGPGLTPAGDDVLVGYLACRRAFGPPPPGGWDRLAAALAPRLLALTTEISAAFLAHVLRGSCSELLLALLRALDAAAPARIGRAARALLALGETSGSDLLAGVCLALDRSP